MNKILSNKKAIAVFVLPTVILFTLILFVPVIQMIGYSFTDYNALSKPSFCGLKNYRTMMKDDVLLTALKNSIFFLLFSVVTQQIIGILLAVLLTNIKKGRNYPSSSGRNLSRISFIFPVFFPARRLVCCGRLCLTPAWESISFLRSLALRDRCG